MPNIKKLIKELPKAELHLHIEGSLEPELMFKLANKNNIQLPYESVEEIRNAFNFNKLQDFLNVYYTGMSVLIEEQDFFDLTMMYLEKCNEQNIRHVEIFFDPQGHTERGICFSTVITGIDNALKEALHRFGISSKIIMCFLRHLSEEDAFVTLSEAKDFLHIIDGVGLDSAEVGNPPSKFKNVFIEAKEMGLKLVAHAGEEGPPSYVEEALSLLKIDRLDHGNRSLESEQLIKELQQKQIALTVCPLSNLKLCVVDDLTKHPIRKMLELGLLATINSDDPSYFGGYLIENFNAIKESLNLNQDEVVTLIKNGFKGSFLTPKEKDSYIKEIDKYLNELH